MTKSQVLLCYSWLPAFMIEGNTAVQLNVHEHKQATFPRSNSWPLHLIHESHESPWISGKQPLSLFAASTTLLSFPFHLFPFFCFLFTSLFFSSSLYFPFSCFLYSFHSSSLSLHSHLSLPSLSVSASPPCFPASRTVPVTSGHSPKQGAPPRKLAKYLKGK